jgi:hypothetical protein
MTNLVCLIAFSVQFGNVFEGYINPEQTNTNVHKKELAEFPLILKICPNPGFNEIAVREAGYQDSFHYFEGQSKFNHSVYGGAGHTSESGVQGNVTEVASKVALYTAEEVLTNLSIFTFSNEWIDPSLEELKEDLKLWRMNYPYNCFTLDLTNNSKVVEKGVKQMFLTFPANLSVEVLLQGKNMACNRDIKYHKFYSSGDNVRLDNLGHTVKRSYVVQIKENIFVEADTSKDCRVYPTAAFPSYKACDDQYMKDFVATFNPADLVPVWLTDDVEKTTTNYTLSNFGEDSK